MLFTQLQVNSLELIPSLHNTNSTGPDNSDSHSNNKPILQYSDGVNTTFTIIKGIIYSVIIMSALFGNALVFIAFLRFTRLRRVRTNIFLISLALADFIVALLVMPFNAIMSLSNHKWIFGKLFCDIYNATDVLFSTASILHLCCISTDRYIAIIHPLNYEIKMSKKRISILLCLTWTLSFFISFIPILLGWHKPFAKLPQFMTPPPSHGMKQEHADSTNDVVDDPFTCDFNVNPYYATISSSISFWIPSVIMVVVYIRIFIEARRQERKIARLQINYHQFDNNDNNNNNNNNNIKQPQTPSSIKPLNFLNKKCRSTDKLCTNYTAVSKRLTNSSFCSNNNNNNHSSSTPCIQITDERYKAQIKIKHESKAARTLGVVMGAFLLCWLPFFLWYTITNLCKCPYPSVLQEILFWIGYLNSTINPIIYAFYNRTFRNAFIKIIECQKATTSSDDPQQQMDSYRSPVTRRNKMDALADGRYASVRIEDSNRSTNVPYFTENKSIDYEDNI